MKKVLFAGLALAVLLFLNSGSVMAISVDFVPPSQTVPLGTTVDVDIVISGLGLPPSVGSFDLDVSFDPAILNPIAVTFGPFLGNPDILSGETITGSVFLTGVVDFFEISLLTPAELDTLQAPSFTLAILSFDTLDTGTSPLTFSDVIVGDAYGSPLAVSAGSGSVNVVPEPATLLLFGPGLAGLVGYRYRRRRMLN